ncbi:MULTISPECIES: hypothetical protein [Chroococcidiopsis]|nr:MULTISPECIES: hypothetical protein [Chroococcidiopsis]
MKHSTNRIYKNNYAASIVIFHQTAKLGDRWQLTTDNCTGEFSK